MDTFFLTGEKKTSATEKGPKAGFSVLTKARVEKPGLWEVQ